MPTVLRVGGAGLAVYGALILLAPLVDPIFRSQARDAALTLFAGVVLYALGTLMKRQKP